MVEKYMREILAYGEAIRTALKAARDGYEPDACDELQSLMERSAEEEVAAATAVATAKASRAAEEAATKAKVLAEREAVLAERQRAREEFEQEEAERQKAQAELGAQRMAQRAELERPINERRWTQLQSSALAHSAAPGSIAVAATMQVGMGHNPEWTHYRKHGDYMKSLDPAWRPHDVPECIPHVRLQLEAFRVAGDQEAAPWLWRTPGWTPSYSADGCFTTEYLMNGISSREYGGGEGMCISTPHVSTYLSAQDPCPFCKRDQETLTGRLQLRGGRWKWVATAAQSTGTCEPPRKRRKLEEGHT